MPFNKKKSATPFKTKFGAKPTHAAPKPAHPGKKVDKYAHLRKEKPAIDRSADAPLSLESLEIDDREMLPLLHEEILEKAPKRKGETKAAFLAANEARFEDENDLNTSELEDTESLEAAVPSAANGFADFNLSEDVQKAITEMGFTSPSPIQQEALPILLGEATDFLGLAATGTGKTAAFGIPLLEKLQPREKGVQALILCPTRELAKQVAEQMNLLARYKRVKTLAIYGGSDYSGQLRALKEGVSIVVGTPGRIIDHLERGTLNLDALTTVILDEADEMISMGFKEDIEAILEKTSEAEQLNTWLFSATMSREIRKIADQFLTRPKQIQINKTEMVTTAVKQYFYMVREDDKPEVIGRLIDQVPGFYGLIFCQTKALVIDLTTQLKKAGYAADCLHGDMEQAARERVMKAFKAKDITILICTDVASRGIDVKDLTHVINYSIPRELDLYVHRIGRTGRGGKEGLALSLVTKSHLNLLRKVEQMMKVKVTEAKVPSDAELLNIKVSKLLKDFQADPTTDALSPKAIEKIIETTSWKDVIETMTKEEIVGRFLSRQLKAPKELKADPLHPKGGFREDRRREFMNRQERRPAYGEKRRYQGERSYGDRPKPTGMKFAAPDFAHKKKNPWPSNTTFGPKK